MYHKPPLNQELSAPFEAQLNTYLFIAIDIVAYLVCSLIALGLASDPISFTLGSSISYLLSPYPAARLYSHSMQLSKLFLVFFLCHIRRINSITIQCTRSSVNACLNQMMDKLGRFLVCSS